MTPGLQQSSVKEPKEPTHLPCRWAKGECRWRCQVLGSSAYPVEGLAVPHAVLQLARAQPRQLAVKKRGRWVHP